MTEIVKIADFLEKMSHWVRSDEGISCHVLIHSRLQESRLERILGALERKWGKVLECLIQTTTIDLDRTFAATAPKPFDWFRQMSLAANAGSIK